MRWLLWLCLGLVWSGPALAHKPSDSYLQFTVQENRILGQWDVALRDLDYAIGLDSDNNGAITWGELRRQEAAVLAYAQPRLQLTSGGACPVSPTGFLVDNHTDGAYAVLRFTATCAEVPAALKISYRLFFDLDPQHRGLLNLKADGQTQTAIFSPAQAEQTLTLGAKTAGPAQFLGFVGEGIWHLWFDHILFLLTLLLPAVLVRQGGKWVPVSEFPFVFQDVLKVVTAFTVAHSITLSLATLGVVQLPSRWVESVIAFSVVLAALNNFFPLLGTRRWLMAFGFGLIHGFGFASVLADLNLLGTDLLLALVGFNLGVEAGQLVIVALFLPLAFITRESWFYRRVAFLGGSGLVVGMGLVWLVERLFDFTVI